MSLRRFLWLLMLCLPAARVGAVPAIVCGDQLLQTRILPSEHQSFGTPASPGIDGDPRVTLLIANVRSPAGAADSLGWSAVTIGGFFNDEDEYPNDDKHPFSNEREMVTLNAS